MWARIKFMLTFTLWKHVNIYYVALAVWDIIKSHSVIWEKIWVWTPVIVQAFIDQIKKLYMFHAIQQVYIYIYTHTHTHSEHKVFSWLHTFITRKLRGIQTYFLPLVKLVSKILCHFSTRWCTSTLGVHTFVGFWMQLFQVGGLGEMVRHPGHHNRRISTPPSLVTTFYWGMLRTNCFRHQFQILEIWRQE